MESTVFITTTPLNAGQSFPAGGAITDWDEVLNYTSYFIQVSASTKAKITVFQSTPADPTATVGRKSVVSSFQYSSPGLPAVFSGNLVGKFVTFIIQNNTTVNQTYLSFSVVYK
jgi:hypothetical protein